VLALPDNTSSAKSGDLRVAPLDVLGVKVFGVEALNGNYQVDQDGRIKMPLVGVIQAKGFTIFELATAIEARLSEGFLEKPEVSIQIVEEFGQQVTLEGAVEKPGMYPVRGDLTLMQAIAIGGGPSDEANPKRVIVFRTVEGKRTAGGFDLSEIRQGRAEDPRIYGNDIIVVDGSRVRSGYAEFLRTVPLLGVFVALATP
jgi:polysaccharide export outer membrane protein